MPCSTASSSPLNTVVLVYNALFLLSSPASLSFSVFSYFTIHFFLISLTTCCNVSPLIHGILYIFFHPMMSLTCSPFSSTLSHFPSLHCLTFITFETCFWPLDIELYTYIFFHCSVSLKQISQCSTCSWSACADCLFFPNELHCTLIEGFLLLFSNANIILQTSSGKVKACITSIENSFASKMCFLNTRGVTWEF